MSKRTEFIAAAKSQVNKGIYVWGGNGENLLVMDDPFAWILKKETSKKNADRDMILFRQRVAQGVDPIRAFDCSGMIYWCNKEAKIGYSDKSANGYYRECKSIDELQAGDLVFHHNGIKCTHVGMYVGSDTVIECAGRDVGVVESVYSKRVEYWNRKGRLKKLPDEEPVSTLLGDANCDGVVSAADASLILRYLEGLSDLTEQGKINADYNQDGKITKEDAELILASLVGLQTVYVIGGSVYVREGDNTGTNMIGIAHRGDTFTLKGVAPSGWYNIDYKGKNGFITNNPKYTRII